RQSPHADHDQNLPKRAAQILSQRDFKLRGSILDPRSSILDPQFFTLLAFGSGISVPWEAVGVVTRSLKKRREMSAYILPAISAARRPASVEPVVMTVTTILGSSTLENEVNSPSLSRDPVHVPVLPATWPSGL